jgi:hypothetical protein
MTAVGRPGGGAATLSGSCAARLRIGLRASTARFATGAPIPSCRDATAPIPSCRNDNATPARRQTLNAERPG